MWKWTKRIVLIVLLGGIGYVVNDYYSAGLHTRPEMPPGAFSLSYKNGLRAIMVDIPNQKDSRRYFGFPFEVPFYLEDTWSFCTSPDENDEKQLVDFMNERDWPGERLEAICRIQVGDESVLRGVITTVPKL